MNFLELYAGSAEFSAIANSMGFNTTTVDWEKRDGIDVVKDIEILSINDVPTPNHIHIGTDCTTYTIAAISTHRNGIEPKTEYAKKCDRINIHVIELINKWTVINPRLTYSFENPRGMLRHMPFMHRFKRYTIWYCQYGDERAKPTDIWTNLIWTPRPECHNYKYKNGVIVNKHCHHESARRGAKTGTQGRDGSYERSKMPHELCVELLNAIIYTHSSDKIINNQYKL